MTDKKLSLFVGQRLEFDFKPKANALYSYHIKAKLYNAVEDNYIANNGKITPHKSFYFKLEEVDLLKDKYFTSSCEIEEFKPRLERLYLIKWNKVKLISNIKVL